MHIDVLEKKWVYLSGLMTLVMVLVLAFYAVGSNIHPRATWRPSTRSSCT